MVKNSEWWQTPVTIAKNKCTRGCSVTLGQVLGDIPRRERNQRLFHRLWSETDEARQKKIKSNLPMWWPGGEFSGKHNLCDRTCFSGFMCLDIDGHDNCHQPFEIKRILADWANEDGECICAYAGLSCRRSGVFALLRLPDEAADSSVFRSLALAAIDELWHKGIVVDPASCNPAQPRFLAFDPKPVFCRNPAIWTKRKELQPSYRKITPSSTYAPACSLDEQIEDIVYRAERANEPIFNSFSEWWQLSLALSGKYGESGRNWFIRLSNVWSNLNGRQSENPDAFYDKALSTNRYKVDIGFVIGKARKTLRGR